MSRDILPEAKHPTSSCLLVISCCHCFNGHIAVVGIFLNQGICVFSSYADSSQEPFRNAVMCCWQLAPVNALLMHTYRFPKYHTKPINTHCLRNKTHQYSLHGSERGGHEIIVTHVMCLVNPVNYMCDKPCKLYVLLVWALMRLLNSVICELHYNPCNLCSK